MIPRGPIAGYPLLRDALTKPERTLRGALCELLLLTQGESAAADERLLRLLRHESGGLRFAERVASGLDQLEAELVKRQAERAARRTLEQAQQEIQAGTVTQLSGGSPGALPNQAAVSSRATAADQANGGECQGGEARGETSATVANTPALPPRLSWCCASGCNGVIPASSAERYLKCTAHGLPAKQWPAGEPEPQGLAAEIGDDLPDYTWKGGKPSKCAQAAIEHRERVEAESGESERDRAARLKERAKLLTKRAKSLTPEQVARHHKKAESSLKQPTRGQVELVGQVINRLPRLGGPCAGCGETVSLDQASWLIRGAEYHARCAPVVTGRLSEPMDKRHDLALRAADAKPFKARHDAAKLKDGRPQGDPVCVICEQAITRGQLARRLEGSSRKRAHDSCVVLWLEDTDKAQEASSE